MPIKIDITPTGQMDVKLIESTRTMVVNDSINTAALWEKIFRYEQALQLIASPMRPDGTWNRDREACRQLAEEALK